MACAPELARMWVVKTQPVVMVLLQQDGTAGDTTAAIGHMYNRVLYLNGTTVPQKGHNPCNSLVRECNKPTAVACSCTSMHRKQPVCRSEDRRNSHL